MQEERARHVDRSSLLAFSNSHLLLSLLLFLVFTLAVFFRSVIAVTNHIQAYKVGRAGLGTRPGDDTYDLSLLHEPGLLQDLLRHVDELVHIPETVAQDRVGSPKQHFQYQSHS